MLSTPSAPIFVTAFAVPFFLTNAPALAAAAAASAATGSVFASAAASTVKSAGLSLPDLSALLLFATAMAFTPGPNTALSAAIGANRGLRHAMPFVLAVPVGWGLLLLGSSLGLGALLQAQPLLRSAIKWAGLAYMLWLAWKLARAGTLAAAQVRGFEVGFGRGVLLQFVNIKAWLNALVISATWVTVAPAAPAEQALRLAQVLPLMMAYGLVSNLTYAWVGAALRSWLSQGRRLLVFNRVLAAVLVATAAWMVRL